jgi:hypothetical protein
VLLYAFTVVALFVVCCLHFLFLFPFPFAPSPPASGPSPTMSKSKGFKITALSSLEEFELVVKDPKKIIIVDAHKKWCGPTTVMRATFERIFATTDSALSRLSFVSIDRELIASHPGFEKSPMSEATLKSSRPLFVLFKHKSVVGKVGGCNAPDIMQLVVDLIAAEF